MAITVRRVHPDEYEEAGEVTVRAYREFGPHNSGDPEMRERDEHSWDDYFGRLRDIEGRDNVAVVLIAIEHGKILGTATLELDARIDIEHGELEPGQAHLRMLGVEPEARGRGVGKLLMEACVAESRKAGKTVFTLNTTERMKTAQTMYESMGFAREPDHVFPDGFVLLSYSLQLSDDA
jgi:ribosomal protein S18 acetylase RimI-like enzyme